MAIFIDIFFAILVLLFVVAGFRKGFIRSLIGFAGAIAALILAIFLGDLFANLLYTGVFRAPLVEKIGTALSSQGSGTPQQQAQAALTALPGFLGNALTNLGVTPEKLGAGFAGSADQMAGTAADMVSPVIIKLTGLVLTVILFFVLLLVVRLVARLVDGVCRLPILKQFNWLLGGAFGLLKGIVVMFLLATVVLVTTPLMKADTAGAVRQTIEKSYICRWFYEHNPVAVWFSVDLSGK